MSVFKAIVTKTRRKCSKARTEKTMAPVKPPNWTAAMTSFLKRALANGEDAKSAIILLETEFPNLVGKVSVGWVEKVRRGEV
ncbi:MAG: hypothetical protein Q9202_005384 [Teloschistes flavicans]